MIFGEERGGESGGVPLGDTEDKDLLRGDANETLATDFTVNSCGLFSSSLVSENKSVLALTGSMLEGVVALDDGTTLNRLFSFSLVLGRTCVSS